MAINGQTMLAHSVEQRPPKPWVNGSIPLHTLEGNASPLKADRLKTKGSKATRSQGRKSQDSKDGTLVYSGERPEVSLVFPYPFGTSQASCLGGQFP